MEIQIKLNWKNKKQLERKKPKKKKIMMKINIILMNLWRLKWIKWWNDNKMKWINLLINNIKLRNPNYRYDVSKNCNHEEYSAEWNENNYSKIKLFRKIKNIYFVNLLFFPLSLKNILYLLYFILFNYLY